MDRLPCCGRTVIVISVGPVGSLLAKMTHRLIACLWISCRATRRKEHLIVNSPAQTMALAQLYSRPHGCLPSSLEQFPVEGSSRRIEGPGVDENVASCQAIFSV